MKRTLAGVALVAAVLVAVALSSEGKQYRGRFGLVTGAPVHRPAGPVAPTR
jgi:hypothetical protein